MHRGIEEQVTTILRRTDETSGFRWSLVCTESGLLVASTGDVDAAVTAAGLTSLFDDVLMRARRDLDFPSVDEFTILDPTRGRFVVRPLVQSESIRFFLVVFAPAARPWRRALRALTRRITPLLVPLIPAESP